MPSDYAGRTITLDITSVVSMPFSDLKDIGIISQNDAWKRIINGESLIFTLSITLMIMAMICVFYFLVRSFYDKKVQLGLPIALFELLIIAWFFGSIRMFYLIIGNVEFCSKVEYYSLYLAPLPLAAFIYTVIDVPAFRKLIFGTNCMYLLFYLTATEIELSPINRNYSDMLPAMHLLSGIIIFVLVIALFFGTKDKSNSYVYILRFGVLISMVCGIFEILRFNITKYILNRSWVTTHGVSALAILIIAVSLVIYLISFSTDEYTLKIEKEQLMFLAYRDALTNMPNRASCYKRIEEMEEQGIKEYTMVFIDINNLKTANDVYGHETGDALLKMTAENIKDIFSENGFCARWGGDEFVACVFDKENDAKRRIEKFEKRLANEDAAGTFPFKVSAACGHKYISEKNYMDPIEAIRQADAIMYENKKRMKMAEQ